MRPFWRLALPPCPVESMSYDTESQSRNVLASPLGEEGHEVAKGVQANWIHRGAPRPANPVRRHPAKSVWTRERMIMIRYGDVTAERRHYNTHRPIGRYHNPRPEGPSNLRTLRTFGTKSRQPSHRRCVQCCSSPPSSRAGLHVGMGQMENALMIL